MTRFFGEVGYGESIETAPGVWEDVIREVSYYGDVIRDSRKLRDGSNVNQDVVVQNSISILADGYANEHIFAMRYIKWTGSLWVISDVEVQRPRLLLRLGGIYNGPKVTVSDIT